MPIENIINGKADTISMLTVKRIIKTCKNTLQKVTL